MNVDMKLLQDFLITVMRDEGKIEIKNLFSKYKADKLSILLGAFPHMAHVFHAEDPQIRAVSVTMISMGIIFADSSSNPELRKVFESWVANEAKSRGENVVDFFTKKSGGVFNGNSGQ